MKAAYIPALSTREWLGTKLSAQHAGISSGHCKTHLSVGKVTLTPLSCLPSGLRIRGAFTRLPCPVGRLAKAEGCMWACRIVSAGSCLPSRLPRAPRNPTGRSAGFLPLRGSLYIAFRFLLGAGGSPGHPARVAVYPGCGRCMPVICANARPDAETQKAPSCCAPYPGRIETTEVVPWGTHEERASCARIVSTGQGVDKSHFSGTG